MGAARSGMAVAGLLSKKGARVFISDSGKPENVAMELIQLEKSEIGYEFNGHSDRATDADMAVLSPGIPVSSDIVQNFYRNNIPVYSEIEVAFWYNQSSLIAVTGSNGKTTTVSLIGEMLKKQNPDALIAGNIGQAFSEYVLKTQKEQWSVVELSSFQLETIDKFKADITVILNFAPNHLDRYNSYDDYLKAKWRITKNLTEKELLIYNADDEKLLSWVKKLHIPVLGFSTQSINETGAGLREDTIYLFGNKFIGTAELALKGIHNYMNVMAAVLAASKSGITNEHIIEVLKDFRGVEHRLEEVAVINGVTYINDSKATTVESLMMALRSFNQPVVLIAGGKDKGSDFGRLNALVKEHVKAVVLIGSAAAKIRANWDNLKPVYVAETMQHAVNKAADLADRNEIVLLSPACASFDMFSNYEQRGQIFKQHVMELKGL